MGFHSRGILNMQKAVITILGHDRPGIIAAAARLMSDNHCNIENVSQTILQTEFSGVFIVALPENLTIEALQGILQAGLQHMNLNAHVKAIDQDDRIYELPKSEPFIITTKGPDRRGLVAAITAILASHNVNVTNLQAIFKGGCRPGDNIMIYEVDVPLETDSSILNRRLREKAAELDLSISIQHRNIFQTINRI